MINNGIINLVKNTNVYRKRLTLEAIENALLDIMIRENNTFGGKYIFRIGSTYYYGKNCSNLKELRKARHAAIVNRNKISELFNVKQRIVREHGKNKQIRKYLRQEWKVGKKSRRKKW